MNESLKLALDEGIARLTLNRPEFYNAFDLRTVRTMTERLIELAGDPQVVGVVVTGEGKAFCTGGDLKWVSTFGRSYGEAFHALAASYHQTILEIRRMPKPVVAAINGLAAGGGFSLALACDFRVMETSAQLRQAYTSKGLSIDGGGTFTLPRIVGTARALEIAAFDPPISSSQAQSWGLVTEVVEDGHALEKAVELVERINNGPLSSSAISKRLFNESFNPPLETQLENERAALSWCADHPNGHEGIAAFVEKRRPLFDIIPEN